MRILVQPPLWRRDAHFAQQGQCLLPCFLPAHMMLAQAFFYLIANGQDRVEGRHGVLEYHGHVAAAETVHGTFVQ